MLINVHASGGHLFLTVFTLSWGQMTNGYGRGFNTRPKTYQKKDTERERGKHAYVNNPTFHHERTHVSVKNKQTNETIFANKCDNSLWCIRTIRYQRGIHQLENESRRNHDFDMRLIRPQSARDKIL